MTFCHGFLQNAGKMRSLEKKAVFIAFPYTFHVAERERKHVATGLPRPLLTKH